ncbi:hypothetical protein BH11PSE2_BH11PSE2_16590 [soil metagenome]
MHAIAWLQDSAFSTWTRESSWALFAFLIVHTMGMGFLIGTAMVINLRVLGFASTAPLSKFARFAPVMVIGLIVAVTSGLLLVTAYPAKALTNPIFYIKLTLVITALIITRALVRRLLSDPAHDLGRAPAWARRLAIAGLVIWPLALAAGKFLPYTHRMLLVY